MVAPGNQRACEILGLDPLYVANEGKLQAIVPPSEASAVLAAIPPTRAEATIIGEVTAEHPSFVLMKTRIGGTRVVDLLSDEQLHLLKFFWSAKLAGPIVWQIPKKERRNDGNYNNHRINPESKRFQCLVRLTN